MWVNPNITRKIFFENRRVLTDKFNWTKWDSELVLAFNNRGKREGFRGLRFYEVLEVDHRLEIFLFLHSMVYSTISDEFDLNVVHKCSDELEVDVCGAVKIGMIWEKAHNFEQHCCSSRKK